MHKLAWTSASFCCLATVIAACGTGPGTGDTSTGSGASASGGSHNGTTSGTGGDVIIETGSGNTGTGNAGNTGNTGNTGGACAGQTTKAEQIPLDIYLMLDSSGSMSDTTANGQTKWDAVTQALGTFFADPKSAGLGVGLQHFPLTDPSIPASCTTNAQCAANGSMCVFATCSGFNQVIPCDPTNDQCSQLDPLSACIPLGMCGNNYCAPAGQGTCSNGQKCSVMTSSICSSDDSCTGGQYAAPAVEITPLNGAASQLDAAISGWAPGGATPTAAALSGAIQHAQSWATQNPTHSVVVVLATDGMPTECTPMDIPSIAQIAAQGASGSPGVKTFAIGVFAQADIAAGAETDLNTIAASGGTTSAFVIDTTQNVEAQFLAALDKIRSSKLACEFQVPAPTGGGSLDYDKVNVKYTPQGGAAATIGYVGAIANCDPTKGGWYYDVDPTTGATPTKITMCKATCDTFSAATGGQVDIEVGCATQHQPPPA